MALTYDALATTTLSSATTSIAFTSINQTYTDLRLVFQYTFATQGDSVNVTFNNNTNFVHFFTRLFNTGAPSASASNGQNNFFVGSGFTTNRSLLIMDVSNYTNGRPLAVLWKTSFNTDGTNGGVQIGGGRMSTSACTSIQITANQNFAIGTNATLYGIKRF